MRAATLPGESRPSTIEDARPSNPLPWLLRRIRHTLNLSVATLPFES